MPVHPSPIGAGLPSLWVMNVHESCVMIQRRSVTRQTPGSRRTGMTMRVNRYQDETSE